jgi:hypothetical protein
MKEFGVTFGKFDYIFTNYWETKYDYFNCESEAEEI